MRRRDTEQRRTTSRAEKVNTLISVEYSPGCSRSSQKTCHPIMITFRSSLVGVHQASTFISLYYPSHSMSWTREVENNPAELNKVTRGYVCLERGRKQFVNMYGFKSNDERGRRVKKRRLYQTPALEIHAGRVNKDFQFCLPQTLSSLGGGQVVSAKTFHSQSKMSSFLSQALKNPP